MPVIERLKPRQLMESQIVTENPDGSVVYEMVVNSLSEIASRGEGVNVLEPKEFRNMVIDIAKGILRNYWYTWTEIDSDLPPGYGISEVNGFLYLWNQSLICAYH